MNLSGVAIAVGLILSPIAHAEKYALLVGVGKYEKVRPELRGPKPDVVSLKQELTTNWGFRPSAVYELIDSGATKTAILSALDSFVAKLKNGDVGFFYFSGHGTSFFDTNIRDAAKLFDPNSGALIPYDARIGAAADVSRSLIMGNRDIRPRLQKIAKGATVLVIFDSCYSGASARSLLELPHRGIPASQLVDRDISNEEMEAFGIPVGTTMKPIIRPDVPNWPYANVLYISAASKMQKAVDIDQRIIDQHPTVDKQPHGALTNSILKGLKGFADSNHDGTISYQELYRFASESVETDFNHKPQFESPGPQLSNAALFGQTKAPAGDANEAPKSKTRVRVENVPVSLHTRIGALPDVVLTDKSFDLLVRPSGAGFALLHSSYDPIRHYNPNELDELVHRVAAHKKSVTLLNLTYRKQSFNVAVDLNRIGGSGGEGDFLLEDVVRPSIECERACFPMVINIDTAGNLTILHASKVALPAGRKELQEVRVSEPVGLEYVKVVAFEAKPMDFDKWADRVGDTVPPNHQDYDRFIGFLQAAGPETAQNLVKLFTSKKP